MTCIVAKELLDVIDGFMIERKDLKKYCDILISGAELNLLNIISKYPEYNSLDYSIVLNVTKGAVTQLSKKLLAKELIIFYHKEGNKKEKYFKLTELGLKIKGEYENEYLESNLKMCNFVSRLSKEEKLLIINFLNLLKENNVNEFDCFKGGEKC